jgi:hypothetical protein
MTIGEISTIITRSTGANTTNYPNSQRAVDVTNAFNKVVSLIIKAQGESDYDDTAWGDYAEGDFALTANRDYPFDTAEKILSIKKLSVSYDGTTYHLATPIDSGEMDIPTAPAGTTMETTIDSYFDSNNPRYDFKNGALFLYPRATSAQVAAGAKAYVEYVREPSPFTSSDVSTGTRVPSLDSVFHPLLAIYPSIDWNIDKGKDVRGLLLKAERLEQLIESQYSKKVLDRKLALTVDVEGEYT